MRRYAKGDWITWQLIALASALTTLATLGLLIFWAAFGHGTLDAWDRPIGTDFSAVYTAGRMALSGNAAAIYDWTEIARAETAFHGGPGREFYGWHYPPYLLFLMVALATLPYLLAFAVWQAATFAAFAAVVQRILPGWRTFVATAGFPAVFVCLGHGHNGFLTASLFGGALLALPARPILAGILFACLAYKPQFALVVPLALLFGAYWRTLAAAAVTLAALTLLTLAVWGTPIWRAFLQSGTPTRTILLEQGATGWQKIISVFSWIRMLGFSVQAAYLGQGAVTLAVLAGIAWLWRGRADLALRGAALMLAALLSTPYAMDYDLALLGPAIALLTARGLRLGFADWEKTLLALTWLAPVLNRPVATVAPVQLAFCTMAALFTLVLLKAFREQARARSNPANIPIPA